MISSFRSACSASSFASSSRAACHSSRVPIVCSGISSPPVLSSAAPGAIESTVSRTLPGHRMRPAAPRKLISVGSNATKTLARSPPRRRVPAPSPRPPRVTRIPANERVARRGRSRVVARPSRSASRSLLRRRRHEHGPRHAYRRRCTPVAPSGSDRTARRSWRRSPHPVYPVPHPAVGNIRAIVELDVGIDQAEVELAGLVEPAKSPWSRSTFEATEDYRSGPPGGWADLGAYAQVALLRGWRRSGAPTGPGRGAGLDHPLVDHPDSGGAAGGTGSASRERSAPAARVPHEVVQRGGQSSSTSTATTAPPLRSSRPSRSRVRTLEEVRSKLIAMSLPGKRLRRTSTIRSGDRAVEPSKATRSSPSRIWTRCRRPGRSRTGRTSEPAPPETVCSGPIRATGPSAGRSPIPPA